MTKMDLILAMSNVRQVVINEDIPEEDKSRLRVKITELEGEIGDIYWKKENDR